MILEFSMKVSTTSNKLRQIILDYENLPMFLPDQLKKIKILEQNETEIITEETFLFSSVFKKTIVQKSLHKILSDNHLHTDVIEGIAKGSKIDIFFSDTDLGTNVSINVNLKLGLKYKIFQPLIKKYYKNVLTGILYRLNNRAENIT